MSSAAHPRHLRAFVEKRLSLRAFLEQPGDGRRYPQIRARSLVWIQLIGYILRIPSFLGLETLMRAGSCRTLGIERRFSDEALRYFTAALDLEPIRRALASVLRRAKRNKAFGQWIGLGLDGTGTASRAEAKCSLCRRHKRRGFEHPIALISVVGTGLSLPFDVEAYGSGDSELSAAKRLLTRAVSHCGRRFAHYVVGDALYATAPFLHLADSLGLYSVVRLNELHPGLLREAEERFAEQRPIESFKLGNDHIEIWDAADFDAWRSLDWPWLRIVRYRQIAPDASLTEAYWITNIPPEHAGARTIFSLAKSRWEIENQGFNDAKNRYGLTHIRHHHANSLQASRLLLCLALTIERLYRLRYLHRGDHAPYRAAELHTILWISLGAVTLPIAPDTS